MKGMMCGGKAKKPKAMAKGGMAKMDMMPMAKKAAKKPAGKKGGVSNMMLAKMGRNKAKMAV